MPYHLAMSPYLRLSVERVYQYTNTGADCQDLNTIFYRKSFCRANHNPSICRPRAEMTAKFFRIALALCPALRSQALPFKKGGRKRFMPFRQNNFPDAVSFRVQARTAAAFRPLLSAADIPVLTKQPSGAILGNRQLL